MYGREEALRRTVVQEEGRIIVIKDPVPVKVVLVVRWRDFGILDEEDAVSLIKVCIKNLNIKEPDLKLF